MSRTTPTFVQSLTTQQPSRQWVERKLALQALGVVAALEAGQIDAEKAGSDLFNLDNYDAIRRRRPSAELRELFEWGMELEDVATLTPQGLPESFAAIRRLAGEVLKRG